MHIIGGMETTLLIHKQYGVDGQRTPLVSGVRYLCHILPCLILRVRVKSKAQPKGTKQPNVLGAHRYCLDEEVRLSSSCNPSVYIYNSFRLSSLAQAVWKWYRLCLILIWSINWGLSHTLVLIPSRITLVRTVWNLETSASAQSGAQYQLPGANQEFFN